MITLRRPVKEYESEAAAFKQEFMDNGELTINGSEYDDIRVCRPDDIR